MDSGFLFTSESVTEGHPDKIADQISDAVVDAALAGDPYSRVACETLLTTGLIVVAGEITTASTIDYAAIARKVVCDIGYDNGEYFFDGNAVGVVVAMDRQSPDIAQGVDTAHEGRVGGSEDPLDKIGAGDDFFILGGNSLIALDVVARAKQHFAVEVNVSRFLTDPTPRALGRLLREACATAVAR